MYSLLPGLGQRTDGGKHDDGDRRRRPRHQMPGRTPHGGHDGRQHRRIQAIFRRHAGNGGKRHRLRHQHQAAGQSGDRIGAQGDPVHHVPPAQEWKAAGAARGRRNVGAWSRCDCGCGCAAGLFLRRQTLAITARTDDTRATDCTQSGSRRSESGYRRSSPSVAPGVPSLAPAHARPLQNSKPPRRRISADAGPVNIAARTRACAGWRAPVQMPSV